MTAVIPEDSVLPLNRKCRRASVLDIAVRRDSRRHVGGVAGRVAIAPRLSIVASSDR